jgi:hypothetical protein
MTKITSKNNKKHRSTVISEKLVVPQVKKFIAFHGTQGSLQCSYDTAIAIDHVLSQMNCRIPVPLPYDQL